jgi:hypothetical protein
MAVNVDVHVVVDVNVYGFFYCGGTLMRRVCPSERAFFQSLRVAPPPAALD